MTKKDAIKTLGEVLEFLRKEGVKLPNKDGDTPFSNNELFRHPSSQPQSTGRIRQEIWYD